MRISDWSSDVCSSDLSTVLPNITGGIPARPAGRATRPAPSSSLMRSGRRKVRSEEHTSELQSLMRNSYAVFCLKKKKIQTNKTQIYTIKTQAHNNQQVCRINTHNKQTRQNNNI